MRVAVLFAFAVVCLIIVVLATAGATGCPAVSTLDISAQIEGCSP